MHRSNPMKQNQSQLLNRLNHARSVLNLALGELDAIEEEIIQANEDYRPDEWISTQEAADICGLNRSTLNRYALSGQCEAKRIGGVWRFPRSRVENMSF